MTTTSSAMDGLRALICAKADEYGLPRDLLAAVVMQESGGRVDAVSYDGGHGRGLMQVDDRWHDYDHARMLADAAYALDAGCRIFAANWRDFGGVDDTLRAYNGDWSDANGYVADVRRWLPQFASWKGDATMDTGAKTGVAASGQNVADAATRHLGETRESDARNGTYAVAGMCQAFVQDVYAECGVTIPTYPDAAGAGDAVTLTPGMPPVGAQIFLRGAGWSAHDHTGLHVGGGRVVSALASITMSDGWLALPTYRGWWLPPGVLAAAPPVASAVTGVTVPGNPYGVVAMPGAFAARWRLLDAQGLALPMLGYPMAAVTTLASGRRVQRFERGWLGTQDAPAPWDVVQLLPRELPA